MSRHINLSSFQKVFTDTISKLSKRFVSKKERISIGRWDIDYDMKTINYKIDRANQDYCGPCGYTVSKEKNYEN
jgi:hypothetical protein